MYIIKKSQAKKPGIYIDNKNFTLFYLIYNCFESFRVIHC
jgi:hypothetical protein